MPISWSNQLQLTSDRLMFRARLPFHETAFRRKVPLWQVMPAVEGWRLLVLLTEVDVALGGGEYASPRSFSDLAGLFAGEVTEAMLATARASGRLAEGRKVLQPAVTQALSIYSGARVEAVRHGFDGQHELVMARPEELTELVANQGNDETEICPASLRWYARFRNDDPLIFLAAEKDVCAEVLEAAPGLSMLVSREFIYAY